MVLRCDLPLFWLLPSPPKCFRHRVLQRVEFGPPPCQCSSVIGVIEVGALSTEAARSFRWSIAARQMNSIQ